ncbi:MAG: hypothetical protein A2V85_17370 [Chloroflexi bacterium RBG_16_72_14]|nr:MAG: hypothetical protein A2V85_17370 [Chloroflexi bacterium RBG_16_72_14]
MGGTPSAIGTPVYGAQGQGEVGRVEVIEPLSWEGNLVDAAAVAAGNIRVDPTVRGHPVISGGPPTLGQEVEKRGASTGRTAGVVSAIELDGVTVSYGTSRLVFDDQIEIDTIEGVFSGQGDSGSAIITVESDAPPRVIGLLFAGPVWDDGTPSYANPIASVFAALGIDG